MGEAAALSLPASRLTELVLEDLARDDDCDVAEDGSGVLEGEHGFQQEKGPACSSSFGSTEVLSFGLKPCIHRQAGVYLMLL